MSYQLIINILKSYTSIPSTLITIDDRYVEQNSCITNSCLWSKRI